MNLKDVIRSDKVNFTGIESSYFLLGLLSAFENRFQTKKLAGNSFLQSYVSTYAKLLLQLRS